MNEVEKIHEGERIPTLRAISRQSGELYKQESQQVTCPCGATGPLEDSYRCFYCDVIFCPSCAEAHFEWEDKT